jgi:hypothetical protein
MKRVGIFLLLARCHRAENHQRQQRELAKKERSLAARSGRSDQAKRAATRSSAQRDQGRQGPRITAVLDAGLPARRRKMSPPCSKVAPVAEEKPANGASAKAEAQATTPHSLGWGLGAGSPKVRVKDRIGPTGETP